MRVVIRHPQGNLVHIEFTQVDRTGGFKFLYRNTISLRYIVCKEGRPGSREYSCCLIQVFHRQRDAVQRAKISTLPDNFLRPARLIQR